MTYYEDLSEYSYHEVGVGISHPKAKNVGWLAAGKKFRTSEPTKHLLDKLWNICKVSVVQMRGIHQCELCPNVDADFATRNDENLLLGSAEIRVFSHNGDVYAAPTLIYHYMLDHQYLPPDEFLRALNEGPIPPAQEYFERLAKLGLEWWKTSAPAEKPERFRFVRETVGGETVIVKKKV